MITSQEYFAGYPDNAEITDAFRENAEVLLSRVNDLLDEATSQGVLICVNPKTQTNVSGQHDGGWRPKECPIGALNSAHKQAQAVDVYDPGNHLDDWLTTDPGILVRFDLYREAPESTDGWCHLSSRAPHSGNRTFIP